jgi:protein-disulfide isomerase
MSIANSPLLTFALAAVAASSLTALAMRGGDAPAPRAEAQLPADFDGRVTEIVARYVKENPEKIVESVNAHIAVQQAQAQKNEDQQAVDKRGEIGLVQDQPFIGNEKGDVTLVYFFDSNCHFCKKIDPVLKAIVAANPDVKIVHREIPVLGEPSQRAAQLGTVTWKLFPAKYPALHDAYLTNEGQLTPDVADEILVKALGQVDADAVLAAVADTDPAGVGGKAANLVADNLNLATQAGIKGTPFVYVLEADGVLRGAADDAQQKLEAMIVEARAKRG